MIRTATIFGIGLLACSVLATADSLRLTNGATLQGTYLGGDTREVRFMGPDGVPKSYSITSIQAIEFGSQTPVEAPAPAAAPAPAPARSAAQAPQSISGVTIPSGTVVTVRMIDSIDTKQTAIGERFRASIDDPVVVNGQAVIPRGADCTVQVMKAETGGRVKGSDELALKLYDITINGKPYDVVTEYAQLKSQGEGKKTVRNTAIVSGIGAAIGGIAAGGKGAAIGAAAGAGAGLAGSALKGPHLQVPSESRLTFELRAPLPID